MNIIAVDDEKLALEHLTNTIRKSVTDADIQGFINPKNALLYARENVCDIAFLDIRMRDMTGLELARQIKDIHGETNIIFVTGYADYSVDAFRLYASDYLLKPASEDSVKEAMQHLRNPIKDRKTDKIFCRCFGNFDVFIGNDPIVFKRAKAKELLAYLIDRKGANVTMRELTAVLWEDGADNESRQSNLRNLIAELRKTLSGVGAKCVIRKSRNSISIDCNAVSCDYYDFLHHIPHAVNSYHGEYMAQYSWAEITTAGLPQNR